MVDDMKDIYTIKVKADEVLPCDFLIARGSVLRTWQFPFSIAIEYVWLNGIEQWDIFDNERQFLVKRK